MFTKFYTHIRKALYGMMMLGIIFTTYGTNNVIASLIQDGRPKLPNSLGNSVGQTCTAAPSTGFLFLPFDTTLNNNDWLSQMTSAFDHHYPDYTCSEGEKNSTCTERGMEIDLWSGDTAFPSHYENDNPADPKSYDDNICDGTKCWGISGYYGNGIPGEGLVYYDGHNGYDWALKWNDVPILAAAPGQVEDVIDDLIYGRTVIINHLNGYTTMYSHLVKDENNPSKGSCVQTGDPIGVQGETGKGTGLHLHFRVYHIGNITDPFGWCYFCVGAPPDPLIDFQGETSQNLWYGMNPRSLGRVPTRSNIGFSWDALTSCYLGGPGEYYTPEAPTPPTPFDNATFISDITLPDGTVVSPGQTLTKTWRVKNTGTSTWGSGYQLVFRSGEQMGAPGAVNVPSTAPGQTADISVPLTAPSESGSHQGNWSMRNPQGTYFGDPVWVKVTVQDDGHPPTGEFTIKWMNPISTISPGETFRPTVRVTIGSGQLLGSRGDMLRNTDGNLYGAYKHVAVVGTVNPGQPYDFTFYADDPITAPNSDGIYQTKWQLWQDGRYVGPELTMEFMVGTGGTNRSPSPPSLTDPGDWAVFLGSGGIELKAQHNGDPDGDAVTQYYFEIFESHDIPNSGWITSSTWSPPGLGYWGYQWHVKVKDSRGGVSPWSETRHFNINNPDPVIYDFHWEWCRDAWGGPEKVCFCAQTSGGGLELKLNSASDGSDQGTWKVIGHGDTNLSCSTDADRPPNWGQLENPPGSYRVRLYERPNVGGWDAARTADVTITLPAGQRPGSPDILEPMNSSYLSTRSVHFAWKTTYRTDDYHLLVSTDPGFGSSLVDQHFPVGTTSFDYTFPTDYENLYTKVISTGLYGTNDDQNTFHIDITPPVSVVAPISAITFDTSFGVNWGGVDSRSGLRWYDLQVRDGNRLDSQWQDWLVNTPKTAELFSGQPGHTYYFKVRAMDQVGNWEDWPGGNGDTFTLVDPSAAPPTAWWNDAYTTKRNLIVLNNDLHDMPVHYPLHLHFDASTTPSAADIYDASLSSAKGNDVSIVYNNQTELKLFVQRFTSSQIDLWFPLHAVLGGGQTDNSSYQIYYGYAGATSPVVDANDIFLPIADANTLGLWHFQDGTGTTVVDTSGNGHDGTFYSADWTDGWLGWAGKFNGASSYVDAGNSSIFNTGSNPITLEAWIYLDQDTGTVPHGRPNIVSKWGVGESYYLRKMPTRNLSFKSELMVEVLLQQEIA